MGNKTHIKIESGEWAKMYGRLATMTNDHLASTWDSLSHYDPTENYAPGIGMDAWAEAVYGEMSRRGLPLTKEKNG